MYSYLLIHVIVLCFSLCVKCICFIFLSVRPLILIMVSFTIKYVKITKDMYRFNFLGWSIFDLSCFHVFLLLIILFFTLFRAPNIGNKIMSVCCRYFTQWNSPWCKSKFYDGQFYGSFTSTTWSILYSRVYIYKYLNRWVKRGKKRCMWIFLVLFKEIESVLILTSSFD